MVSLIAFLATLTLLVVMFIATFTGPVKASEGFKVGDSEGWHQPSLNQTDMYTHWTAQKKFHVGDSIRFEYKNDSVLVVDKWGYYHCDTSNPSSVFNDGNTTITLDIPGRMYFISGDPQHCENGQRLLVTVIPLPPVVAGPPMPSYSADSPAMSPLVSSSGASLSVCWMISVLVAVSAAPLLASTCLAPYD